MEIDFHRSGSERGPRTIAHYEAMDNVWTEALEAIQKAYLIGLRTVLFTHGYSTSQPGTITARSQIRDLVEHEDATPYIQEPCIFLDACCVVPIRENPSAKLPAIICPHCGRQIQEKKLRGTL